MEFFFLFVVLLIVGAIWGKKFEKWTDKKTNEGIDKINALPQDKQLDATIKALNDSWRFWFVVYVIASIIGLCTLPVVVIIPIFLGAKQLYNKRKDTDEAIRLAKQIIPNLHD